MKINGSLVFDASSASEIQNLRVQKYVGESVPAWTSADAGRMVFVTTSGGGYVAGTLYYGTSTAWIAIATGGNAAALQTEVDNIEAAIGAAVNGTTGAFDATAFTLFSNVSAPTSITNVLSQLDAAIEANDTLAELDDVSIAGAVSGDYLKYNGTLWVRDVLTLADVTDVTVPVAELNLLGGLTATAAELNVLDGITGTTVTDLNSIAGYAAEGVSATEFGYLDGVTSEIQTQLNDKQPLDATLTALAGLDTGAGIVVQTGTDTFAKRTLVAPAAGITISNAAGTAGDPTFALANDLAALEGLTSVGYVVRTGDGTATTRSLAVNAADLVITGAADGVSTDTTFGLATVTQAASGTFSKITLDTKGRVVGNTDVVAADITGLVSGIYVDVAGDTMTGSLTMGAGTFITLTETATAGTHAVNKAYVDAATNGLSWKQAVKAASTAPLTLATGFAAGEVIDGVTLVLGDRILVKDQAAPAENGIYIVTAGAPTRALDMDAAAEFDGSAVFVQEGSTNEGTGWTETLTVTTVGTSAVAFSQFSGGQAFIWGDGLGNTGNTIFVKMGAGVAILPSDEVGLDIAAGKAVQLTSSATGGQLTFVLDTGSGLEQSATGLKISALGVTNAMLEKSSFVINADSGTDSLILGDTFEIRGTSTQGVTTSVTESPAGTSTFTITAANASSSQKGVATFDATEFTVTNGNVVLGTVPIAKLAANTIALTGTDTSTDTITLGQGFTFASAVTGLVSAAVASDIVTLGVRLATTGATGVASFNSSHFSVTAGAVDLAATLDDLTNVSGADAANEGDLLTKTAGDWAPVSRTALAGTIALGDLQDVGSATPTATYALIGDGTAWQAKKIYHVEDVAVAATTWTVTHGLGVQYCNVTIVDDTNNVVIPQSIVFGSTTAFTVTFNTAVAGKVIAMGIA